MWYAAANKDSLPVDMGRVPTDVTSSPGHVGWLSWHVSRLILKRFSKLSPGMGGVLPRPMTREGHGGWRVTFD